MKWSLALIGGSALLLLTAGAAAMGWSFHQVPAFYQNALNQSADPVERQRQAEHLTQRTMRLVDEIYHGDAWSQEFSDEQINSWLAEELPRHSTLWLPVGVSEPRVHFADGTIHLAFRYVDEYCDAVVSVQLQPEITASNSLAVEFVGAYAGGIPLPMDEVLAELSRMLTDAGWPHVWTDQNGHRVMLLDLAHASLQPTVLETLEVRHGTFFVAGKRSPGGSVELAELFRKPLPQTGR